MNSLKPLGKDISGVEVTNISTHGIWLLSGDKELFLSYDQFPWFKDVPIGKIINVEEPSLGHFYWPDLDVDLGIESIEHPERFPLVSKGNAISSNLETA
ncbi:DUF2442 domain-containing protein [Desulfobacter vibrioformis]|uniref:DUF2442 domain-containing protein n=1 Tax=Desulfobacter vibrioformis TaxID=34031 RepID=UPI00054E80CC|nr:DUF2442 domain-containing protein [Desulfobacter vibrioformis]